MKKLENKVYKFGSWKNISNEEIKKKIERIQPLFNYCWRCNLIHSFKDYDVMDIVPTGVYKMICSRLAYRHKNHELPLLAVDISSFDTKENILKRMGMIRCIKNKREKERIELKKKIVRGRRK